MAYSTSLADRIREYLYEQTKLKITEKRMFSGLAFMVNGKMCVNVSHENLMCRYDPAKQEEVTERRGYQPMVMKGKELTGYCYVTKDGFKSTRDFDYWMKLCLDFNSKAKAAKKKAKKRNYE